jgi:hypothetical protein
VKAGAYRAPGWLPNGHAQTIWAAFAPRPRVAYRREVVEAPDGDRWAFDWLDAAATPGAPLVVLFHGLEGSSRSHYAVALMDAIAAAGWRGVVPHFRGCGGLPNELPRAYHSADHAEIDAMMAAVAARASGVPAIHAAGVSLGGSALLNWLGRGRAPSRVQVARAAAVSAPLDLMAAGEAIAQGFNHFYTQYFLKDLVPKARALARRHPGRIDLDALARVRSMRAFDELVTAPLHGFDGTDDYWTRGSSKPWLARVDVPTLVLNARNDPFIPAASLARPGEVSAAVRLEQPDGGGHAGFVSGAFPGHHRWLPARLLRWFGGEPDRG